MVLFGELAAKGVMFTKTVLLLTLRALRALRCIIS